jgi:hypothetical protein
MGGAPPIGITVPLTMAISVGATSGSGALTRRARRCRR